jgi:hypothetical protein
VDYAAILLGGDTVAPASLARAEFLLTHAIAPADDNGRRTIQSPQDAMALITPAVANRETKTAVKVPHIAYFQEATQRVAATRAAEELFTGGFYIELCNRKADMGLELFDAETLLECAKLNMTIANHLDALESGVPGGLSPAQEQAMAIEAAAREILRSPRMTDAAMDARFRQARSTQGAAPAADQEAAPADAVAQVARDLWLRFQCFSDGLDVIMSTGVVTRHNLESAAAARKALLGMAGRLRSMDMKSPEFVQALDAFALAISGAEGAMMEVVSDLPKGELRAAMAHDRFHSESLQRFALFLGRAALADPQVRDHFDLVATRAMTTASAEGRQLRPKSDVFSLLSRVGHDLGVSAQDAASAVEQLAELATRARDCQSLDELITAVYADLYGFKATLRKTAFHADVLYATAGANVAMGNSLRRLTAAGGATAEAVSSRLTEEEIKVQEIFRVDAQPTDATSARFEQVRAHTQEATERPARARSKPMSRPARGTARLALRVAVGAFLIIGAAGIIVSNRGVNKVRSNELDGDALAAVSPYLDSATVMEAGGGKHMTGTLTEQWGPLPFDDKQRAAKKMHIELASQDINIAILMHNGRPAVRITSGTASVLSAPTGTHTTLKKKKK